MRDSFLGKRIRGGGYAIKGAWLLLKHEQSIQVQFVLAIIMCVAGYFFGITKTEWMFQFVAIGLVMTAEGLNSGLEAMADFVHPDFHSKIGHIKDIAAGAVFIAAVIALIIGVFIYFPYIF
ncbi:diacylglycerol kinase [Salegentibacter salegens]|uniref:Diacylglycerol kinase (ATP) n=1 Tax=Salegentibacter salegens TaxID=143223 RepID=A0A1M7JXG3_9FLAO|nr:diacylglycerol kinase family protein [Salegentibacter salegens]PRX51978.1 diacylglycerol kinase (ATP) [Salegentibacter salegens]SHM57726.1 diacylglycerol kinase (ATP) [Salegentibacter salegens]